MHDGVTWEPTGWWRAILPDGRIWAEARDEAEVRALAADHKRAIVQRHMRRVEQRWEDA